MSFVQQWSRLNSEKKGLHNGLSIENCSRKNGCRQIATGLLAASNEEEERSPLRFSRKKFGRRQTTHKNWRLKVEQDQRQHGQLQGRDEERGTSYFKTAREKTWKITFLF